MLVGYAAKHEPILKWLTWAVEKASGVAGVQLGPQHLHSTLGLHLARAVRTAVICDLSKKHWQLLVDNIASGDTDTFNEPVFQGEQVGFGFHEAPRGTLSHFVVIRDGKIANYQAVVPSTWNAGPRDGQNRPGPYEASLVGNPIADPGLGAARTVAHDRAARAVDEGDPIGGQLGALLQPVGGVMGRLRDHWALPHCTTPAPQTYPIPAPTITMRSPGLSLPVRSPSMIEMIESCSPM